MIGVMRSSPSHTCWGTFHWGYPARASGQDAEAQAGTYHRRPVRWVLVVATGAFLALAVLTHLAAKPKVAGAMPDVGLFWAAPFAVLLLTIALLPIAAARLWDRFYGFIAVSLGLAAAIAYTLRFHAAVEVAGSVLLYLQFMSLVGALFIISSGLVVRIALPATPVANVLLLAVGSLLANVLGTTGAALVLIRPYLRMNQGRLRPFHVVFFVFLVANVGGALTPLGDPPLLLGYLQGVPFWWMLRHAVGAWLMAVLCLLAVFYLWDCRGQRRQEGSASPVKPVRTVLAVEGLGQIIFLVVVLASLLLESPWRELLMILAAGASWWVTPEPIHHEHRFSFRPLWEMGVLFLGIFLTITPVLNMLAHSAGSPRWRRLTSTPGRCYFLTGALSSVLDNAPAYLAAVRSRAAQLAGTAPAFPQAPSPASLRTVDNERGAAALNSPGVAELRRGSGTRRQPQPVAQLPRLGRPPGGVGSDRVIFQPPPASPVRLPGQGIAAVLTTPPQSIYLLAIALGAVFFGAMTWIGNGPNLIIKSLAEQAGLRCPGLLAYVVKYALPVLLPILLLVWLIFLA